MIFNARFWAHFFRIFVAVMIVATILHLVVAIFFPEYIPGLKAARETCGFDPVSFSILQRIFHIALLIISALFSIHLCRTIMEVMTLIIKRQTYTSQMVTSIMYLKKMFLCYATYSFVSSMLTMYFLMPKITIYPAFLSLSMTAIGFLFLYGLIALFATMINKNACLQQDCDLTV